MMTRSDFCICANEASPGATVLKNAVVKNGARFFSFLGFATGLVVLTIFFFNEGMHLVTCGAAEDLVSCGAVEVDGCCSIGDRVRGGSLSLLSSSGSNAVLQKSAVSQLVPNLCPRRRSVFHPIKNKYFFFSTNQEQAQDQH